jgi:DNA gyrase/topoisomerase IV subunit A
MEESSFNAYGVRKSGNIYLSGTISRHDEEAALINPDKIDEWIHEVEERPASAELIIRYIANRLSELASRDEELTAQNIELLSGRKVEEYESRIASLEYQLELLKRQLGGEVILPTEMPKTEPVQEMINVVLFHPQGRVLRLEMNPAGLVPAQSIAKIAGEVSPDGIPPTVMVTSLQEELLLIFDSGRTVARPVTQLPLSTSENFDWQQAYFEEPRIREELAAIHPIAKMPLYEFSIQASRRGFVKKIKMSSFTSHQAEDYIGTGVKLPADKTCGLTFAKKDDYFVMVSQEGYIFSMQAEHLPTAIEEVIRLGITDHIVASFVINQKTSILFITQNGKAVHRDVSWLEPAASFKSKGQAILSKERREAGTRIVGAAPVDETDWGIFLSMNGVLTIHKLQELMARGSVTSEQTNLPILSFSTFRMPVING